MEKMSLKNLQALSIKEILETYSFPHRFYVSFAVMCAKHAISFIKEPYPASLKAISLAERFSLGEDIPQEDLKAAAHAAARAAAHAAARAAHVAAHAAAYAAYAAHAAHAAAYAVNAAANAAVSATYAAAHAAANAAAWACSNKETEKLFKPKLIEMIQERFTEFELIMRRNV